MKSSTQGGSRENCSMNKNDSCTGKGVSALCVQNHESGCNWYDVAVGSTTRKYLLEDFFEVSVCHDVLGMLIRFL